MAHTCPLCSYGFKDFPLAKEDSQEYTVKCRERVRYKTNRGYQHDIHSWKASTKARKQWARHSKRIWKV